MKGIYQDLRRLARDQLDFLCESEDYVVLAVDSGHHMVHVDHAVISLPLRLDGLGMDNPWRFRRLMVHFLRWPMLPNLNMVMY